jgi:hypothetical protein
MVVYNIITSQGQKLQLDLNMNSRIEVICEYLFSLVENMEYITTFDLSLRYENIVLINDKLLIEYNYPSNTKLSFIIKKKGIDIPSPSIYDSPLSLNNSLSNSNENVITNNQTELSSILNQILITINTTKNEINNIKDDINDIKHDVVDIKNDISNLIKDGNDPFNLMD